MSPETLLVLNLLLTVILTIALALISWLLVQVVSLKTEMARLSTSVGHLADVMHEIKTEVRDR